MTVSGRYQHLYFGNFKADTDINNRYLKLLTTKFCRYFSINLTLKASLIPFQRKAIANTSRPLVLLNKKTNQKYNDLAINSQVRWYLLSKINSLR